MKTYNVDLSESGIDKAIDILNNFDMLLTDKNLLKYLATKCRQTLADICMFNLTTISTGEDIKSSDYLSGNHYEIEYDKGIIYLYNNSKVDVSSKTMSKEKRAKYPLQLSLAKIVEYGIGYTGSINAKDNDDDWEYDVNNHGNKGWYYIDKNGKKTWTNGFAGRYIYLKLKLAIETNITNWIIEYVDKNMKD